MKTNHTFLVILFVTGMFVQNAFTRNAPGIEQFRQISKESTSVDLFTSRSDQDVKNDATQTLYFFDQVADVLRFAEVELHNSIVTDNALRAGSIVHLNLFDDTHYQAEVSSVRRNVNGTVTLMARVAENEGYVIIATTGERTLGSIYLPSANKYYMIISDPNTLIHYLIEMDARDRDIIESSPPLIPEDTQRDLEEQKRIRKQLERDGLGPDDPANIDVMIVYTPAAQSWANSNGGGINNVIALSMANAQLVLDNSLTIMTVTLVHSSLVAYTESGNSGTDLIRLTEENSGFMDEVHTWRDQYGADLVALFPLVHDTGGLAWLLINKFGTPTHGFSLTRIQQAGWTYTHIHEMGHNMGLHHHKDQNFQPGPTVWWNWPENIWSAGWRWTGNDGGHYCSVMTYTGGQYFDDGIDHTQVPYFSNPSITYQGVATGHPVDGDNARTLREIKHVIAAYRESQDDDDDPDPDTYPVTFNVNDQNGQPIPNAMITVTSGGKSALSAKRVALFPNDRQLNSPAPPGNERLARVELAHSGCMLSLTDPPPMRNGLEMLIPGNWANATGVANYWWGVEMGYFFGTNLYFDRGYGQRFIVDAPYEIHGALYWFSAADGATGDVIFTIWDWTGSEPGDVIATSIVPLADIYSSTTLLPDEDAGTLGAFYVDFTDEDGNPVEVTSDYVIGVDLTDLDDYTPGTYRLGNYSSIIGDGMALAWIWGVDTWFPTTGYGYDMDIGIFPMISVQDAVTIYTDASGQASFNALPGTYDWTVSASGFINQDGELAVSGPEHTVSVVLEALPPNTVMDIDGNLYSTIVIGEQEWMAENLRVTHYQNGDPIPDGSGLGNVWPDADYFFYYDDDPDYAETYGLLYTDYLVFEDREVCPVGWTIPTNDQWKVMEMQLGMSWKVANIWGISIGHGLDEGGKLKATGFDHWHMPNVGATDEFGFHMLPAGNRSNIFSGLGQSATFYTATHTWGGNIKLRLYSFNHPRTFHTTGMFGMARSLRCIKIQADQSPPMVSTGNVSSVMASSAQVEGAVVDTGNATVVARGIAYGTNPNPEVDTQHNFSFTHDGQGLGSFSGELIDLLPGTTYYARAYAVNANGIAYGDQVNFTTEQASLPTLSLYAPYGVEQTSVLYDAEVIDEGQSNVTSRGLVWSVANGPTLNDNSIEAGSGAGHYTLEITGLEPNTLYYVRAYATNSQGTSYSSRSIFRTLTDSPPPQVEAPVISDLTATSAILGSTLLDDGGEEIMDMGFVVNGEEFSLGSSPEAFSLSLENLMPVTEYVVQAYATNQNGRFTSPSVSFTTFFNTTDEAMTLLQGIYDYMYAFLMVPDGGGHHNFGVKSFDLTNDLMGEDMVVHSWGYGWFNNHYRYSTHIDEDQPLVQYTWARYYDMIDQVNTILPHIDEGEGPDVDKDNIKGQLLALRAFSHFELVQVFSHPYGYDADAPGIPYFTESNRDDTGFNLLRSMIQNDVPDSPEKLGESLPELPEHDRSTQPWLGTGILERGTVSEVYLQLEADLDQAISLLTGAGAQQHPSHIDLAVAHGMRARVALVSEDFSSASLHAQAAIDAFGSDNLFSQGDYPEPLELIYSGGQVVGYDFTAMSGFNNAGESSEWMWGSVISSENATGYASFFSHMDPRFMTYANLGGQKKIALDLYDQIPETDVRRNLFMPEGLSFADIIPSLTQLKFLTQELGSFAADYLYMRLGEMYLIRAEALARSGQYAEAASTLFELVSQRDPAYELSASTGDLLLQEVLLHRRIELWGEGHRFKDIRRLELDLDRPSGSGNHDPDLANLMYLPANDELFLWAIPFHQSLEMTTDGMGQMYVDELLYEEPLLVAWYSNMNIEAVPESGWLFSHWSLNGQTISELPSDIFTMPAEDANLTAHFIEDEDTVYVITVMVSPEEGGVVIGDGEYLAGETAELIATANEGYDFLGWIEGAGYVETEPVYTFTVTQDRFLVAQFAKQTVTVNASANPTEYGDVYGSGVFYHGDPVTLLAVPQPGKTFEEWTENDIPIEGVGPIYGFTATEDRDLVAHFTSSSYHIQTVAFPAAGGTLMGGGHYDHGDQVELNAIANEGYEFINWREGATILTTEPEYSFTVSKNHILIATFARKSYTLTLDTDPAGNAGGIAIGGGNYLHGAEVTVSALNNMGYEFEYWTEDGEVISNAGEHHTFILTSNRHLTAHFAGDLYVITANALPAEGGTVNEVAVYEGSYNLGDAVSLFAEPADGYFFWRWVDDDGNQVSTQNPYYFTATNDRVLNAQFAGPFNKIRELDDKSLVYIEVEILPEGIGATIVPFIPPGGLPATIGSEVTLTASPDPGIDFIHWLDEDNLIIEDDEGNPVGAEYTFIAEANRQVKVVFSGEQYTVIVEADPELGGDVSVSGGSTESGNAFYYGGWATISAEANPGYQFVNWTLGYGGPQLSGNSVHSFTVSDELFDLSEDIVIVANFVEKETYFLNLIAQPESGGSVEGEGSFIDGSLVEINAEANEGFEFVQWNEVLEDEDNQFFAAIPDYTFEIASDLTLEAVFEPLNYIITAEAYPSDAGNVIGHGEYTYGQMAELQAFASPGTGYSFAFWTENDEPVFYEPVCSFEVSGHRHLVAVFELNTYVILATAENGGSIDPSGEVPVEHGSSQMFTITADSGYHIDQVWVDGVDMGAADEYEFEDVESNHAIHATFAINTYVISASAGDGGSISPSGDVSVEHGSSQLFAITADSGYHIDQVWVDGVDMGAVDEYEFEDIESNHTIHATFAINTYVISASAGEGGSISPSGDVSVEHGSSQLFAITADSGYHIDEVLVDGVNIGAFDNYEFEDIESNHTIHATFAINTYVISATAGDGGSIDPSGDVTVEHGSSQLFTITAEAGYLIADVLVDDVSVGMHEEYLFEDIHDNHQIHAVFEPDDTSVFDPDLFEMRVYPNPAQNMLFVEGNLPIGEVRILDMLGQLVYRSENEGNLHEIDVTAYQNGIYLLQVSVAGTVITQMVQVAR